MAGKKSGYVLNEEPPSIGEKSVSDSGALEEEAGSGAAFKPCSSPSDGEVLAGESAAEEIDAATIPVFGVFAWSSHNSHVLKAGDSWPVSGEDSSAVGVGLALEDDSVPRPLKAEVEASDS